MKHLTIIILTFLTLFFISCNGEEPEVVDLCKTATCDEWQECNKANGNCENKENFCSTNGDCAGHNVYCDIDLHTCKEYNKCTDVTCDTWEECSLDDGKCKLKENACAEDGDCLGENKYCNLTEHTCLSIVTACDNVDCGEHGSCLVKEDKTTECICEANYFVKEGQTKCIELNCKNTSNVGHTETNATDIKTLKEANNDYDYQYKHYVCEEAQDVFYFNDSSALLKLFYDSDREIDMNFYRNSISKENIIDYQYEIVSKRDYIHGDDNDYDRYKFISIDNPNNDKIYLVMKDRILEEDFPYHSYHLIYVSSCSNEDYATITCPNAMICDEDSVCNNYCEDYNDCPSKFDCINNKCEIASCDTHLDCNLEPKRSGRLCLEDKCVNSPIYCNQNDDCSVLNTENNSFICSYNKCELNVPEINFGETKFIDLMYKRDFTYKFIVPTPENGKGSFTVTLGNLDNLSDFQVYLSVDLYGAQGNYQDWYMISDYFINNNKLNLKVNHFNEIANIEIELKIKFNNYLYEVDDPLEVFLKLSDNNNIGCQENGDCIEINGYQRNCNLENNSCYMLNDDEILEVSEEGESCLRDSYCIGDNLVCKENYCTKTCNRNNLCPDGEYCLELNSSYREDYCIAKCYSDLDCKNYTSNLDATCNLENNQCDMGY